MNEIIKEENIENMIYEIRGKQVMLDSDLARLYKCKNGTKTINQAVVRHKNRFPERFMFQLSKEEYYIILRSQLGTLELEQGKYSKYMPYVFTEQGVAMLATVLRTSIAEEMSIRIMDAFVAMRHYLGYNEHRLSHIESKLLEHDDSIKELQVSFDKFTEKRNNNEIYFSSQIYDAYSRIVDIFKEAKDELIIIDGYTDKLVLDIIKTLKCKVILITSTKTKITNLDLNKYNKQYNNLTIYYNDTFHDRYFILDKETIYHCGTSINYAGTRTFSINILEDIPMKEALIKNIENIINK